MYKLTVQSLESESVSSSNTLDVLGGDELATISSSLSGSPLTLRSKA